MEREEFTMSEPPDIEYQVLLLFPGFGEERDNAEQIIEEALHYLNTEKDEPGMRFAYNVSAQLDIVMNADQAEARLESEDNLALMILHDLPDEERTALTKACAAKGVQVCHSLVDDSPNRWKKPHSSRDKQRGWKMVFRERKDDQARAHRISGSTLTAPLERDREELGERIGQLIAVMALGVMEVHWTRNPPRYEAYE
jgi:hypothetical protein